MLWLCWAGLGGCALLTELIPLLKPIAIHGKCRSSSPPANSWFELHAFCQVPKSYFKHMYVLGSVFALIVLLYSMPPLSNDISTRIRICLFLWTLHNIRRLWESCCITIFGASTMHLGGYLAGLAHYLLVPLTIYFASPIPKPSSSLGVFVDISAVCLFFLASKVQYSSHEILYQLKRQQRSLNSRPIYEVPTKSYFEYVCCPHYLAEIFVYGSLCILLRFDFSVWLMLFWVTTNLAVVANQQYRWYLRQHEDKVPRNWKRLVPMVW
jgi:3-oxo-5-alpha-steroid 4-dehydrogenase 3 / polyprenol reductase